MGVINLPPSCYVTCDLCGRSLGEGGHDYTVVDRADVEDLIREYGWERRGEQVVCEDCLYEEAQARRAAALPPGAPAEGQT